MIATSTRFLALPEPGVFPNLASRFLAGMTRRLAGDWLEAHGHRALLAGTSCDPELFPGTMHRAAGRTAREAAASRRFQGAAGKAPDPDSESPGDRKRGLRWRVGGSAAAEPGQATTVRASFIGCRSRSATAWESPGRRTRNADV